MTWLFAGWAFVRRHWRLALIVAAIAGLAVLKLRWTGAGKALERAAQAERNRKTKEKADAARDRALASDDPRRDLLRDFRRSDGQ